MKVRDLLVALAGRDLDDVVCILHDVQGQMVPDPIGTVSVEPVKVTTDEGVTSYDFNTDEHFEDLPNDTPTVILLQPSNTHEQVIGNRHRRWKEKNSAAAEASTLVDDIMADA